MTLIQEKENTFPVETTIPMTASKEGIKLIEKLTGEEAKYILKRYYANEETRLRSLALKQLQDLIKTIKK